MAAVRAHTRDAIMDLDRTMHDESILDSGDDSDVMDNIVFRRPVTRGSLKAATSAPVASTSTQPARRRSPRKSTNMSPPPRPTLRSRRISSQTTSSPSSSQSHSQSLTPSQSEPQVISDEPTGMSQDLARVSVTEEAGTDVPDVGMDNAEPHAGEPVLGSPPNLMDMDAQLEPKDDSTDAKETGARTDGALGTRSAALVFETETERASEGGSQTRDKPSTSSRTLLALPVFTVTTLGETSTEEEPSHSSLSISDLGLGPGSQTIDSTSSIENMTDSDISIPASLSSADGKLAPPLTNTPRRSPRLSGSSASTFVPTVFSTVPAHTVQTSVPTKAIVTPTAPASEGVSNTHPPLPARATRPTKKGKAKAPARELGDGPTGPSHDAPVLDPNTITTSSKGKEKEQPLSPAIIPRIKNDTLLKPPQLRSLSPDSDAVLASLHQALSPQTRPALRHLPKSSDRPAPPPSAMKRRAEEEPASPEKRARFDPDPPPPTQPPAPLKQPPLNHARPARIRVHPSNSLVGMAHQVQQSGSSSFVGAHPPIVVRPTGSPSRQQLLLQRNPGPPMRVPVGQPQRIMFPARVPSPVRTGSTNSMGMSSNIIRSTSPLKPQRGLNAKLGIWGPPAIAPAHIAAPNRGAQSSQIKADVLIAPRDGGSTRAPADGSSSPARAGRSRLPVLKASSGVLRTTGEKAKGAKADADDANESGLPPAGTATGSLVVSGFTLFSFVG
ncbi:hypothetical protein BDV93DRAFT_270779 [Ceratobasidium sp. AG-I]|nr:hypothetical protein BDV93DRAFT_270779 [Ceratobasidium sp. AG-I]